MPGMADFRPFLAVAGHHNNFFAALTDCYPNPDRPECGGQTCPLELMGTDMTKLRQLLRDKKGATAIEYGLIAALIAVAAIAAMQGLGTSLNETFTNVSEAMTG